jgi:GNAT superfamily N-acetyltransferase
VPEWGQAAATPALVADLYAAASAHWAAAGRTVHAVTLWAHEPGTEAAWHDLGFGRAVVDAVRGLEAPARRPRGVTVHPAGPRDASTLARLERALWDHLASPPVSRVQPGGPGGRAEAAARLADPARPVWLAEMGGAAAGFISLQPSDDAPVSLRSPDLVRCDGAFVVPERRGRGVGAILLGTALRWAAAAGFTGCTLDYESANLSAARFWPASGFAAVLHSVGRRIA